jgi:methionine synthase II (cobalamin-independent)
MVLQFEANCRPLLIGSLPLAEHTAASQLVFQYTPEIPLWVQLPINNYEGMIPQFLSGLPGVCELNGRIFVDTAAPEFDQQMLEFYEEYMAVNDSQQDLDQSRFVLKSDTAPGFAVLKEQLSAQSQAPLAVKGQVTGPFTFCTGLKDENRQAIFYNLQLKDAAIKLLAMKAAWQVEQLSTFDRPVIIFCDEPALAGFGTSEFLSVSRDDIITCLDEVMTAVHTAGGLVGVHICANTDWSLVLESRTDIVNFDAYNYFDRFILYPELIRNYIAAGKIMAWGIVPTGDENDVAKETVESLTTQWFDKIQAIEDLGIDRRQIAIQSLITPSCGAGMLSPEMAERVLQLTQGLSARLRKELGFESK